MKYYIGGEARSSKVRLKLGGVYIFLIYSSDPTAHYRVFKEFSNSTLQNHIAMSMCDGVSKIKHCAKTCVSAFVQLF